MDLNKTKQETDDSKGVLCASVRDGAPTLVIIPLDGSRWVLPWIHFLYALYEDLHEYDRIKLFYASHEVRLEGLRLKELINHFSSYRIEWIRSYDKRYAELCPKDLPFISMIKVEETVRRLGNRAPL